MNVLFVSNLYPPNIVGGYERLCGDVAQAFTARGVTVTALTSCYGNAVSRVDGQVVHQALQLLVGATIYDPFDGGSARRDAISRANLTALRQVIERAKPDRIFCWNLYGLDQAFLDGLIGCGVPMTVMLTDNWLANMFNPEFVGWYFRSQVFSRVGAADAPKRPPGPGRLHMPCDAVFGAGYMQSFYQDAGLFFARSRVVHNGVSQSVPAGAVRRDRLGTVGAGEFSLLFAGRIVPLKGLRTVIEALPLLNAPAGTGARVTLTVVGDDRDVVYMTEMRGLIETLGAGRDVTFLPPVAEERLFELFQEHDAYVFPSLYEPFSLTLILALAAGMPTAASDVGGNVEIVRDSETGLLFRRDDPADLARAVRRLIDEPRLRAALAREAQKVAAGFTFDRMVEGMLEFISA